MFSSTIAAISTPFGRGGIAVIRISGDEAIPIAEKIFRPRGKKSLSALPGGQAVYGDFLWEGRVLDDGIATLFRAPRSFTGEDTVELSCHGGLLLTETLLTAALTAGATQAEAGEFTKRALLHGKLSLSEAEGIIDLIDAETPDQLRLARAHTSGVFSRRITELYDRLAALVAETYVVADYPDEDLTSLTPEALKGEIRTLSDRISELLDSFRTGHAIAEGIYTVTAGKPNTGKSSLMNALLGRDRAIVSPRAGTTRDYLEEKAAVGKILLRLVDTAGIRDTEDEVEKIGVTRSLSALHRAELILALFDASAPPDGEDFALLDALKDLSVPKLALLNKNDLLPQVTAPSPALLSALEGRFDDILFLSAKTGEGLAALKEKIESLFAAGDIDYDSRAIVANARQNAALLRAKEALGRAEEALVAGFSPDVAGMDLEEALAALGETDGRSVSADVVDRIFRRFCVGK